jgi:hypothetical protein
MTPMKLNGIGEQKKKRNSKSLSVVEVISPNWRVYTGLGLGKHKSLSSNPSTTNEEIKIKINRRVCIKSKLSKNPNDLNFQFLCDKYAM